MISMLLLDKMPLLTGAQWIMATKARVLLIAASRTKAPRWVAHLVN